MRGVALVSLSYLDGELPRWAERHNLDVLVLHIEAREQWQSKSSRFACSGRRMPEQVQPLHKVWNRLRLDRRRRFVANLVQRYDHGFGDIQIAKRQCRGFGLGHAGFQNSGQQGTLALSEETRANRCALLCGLGGNDQQNTVNCALCLVISIPASSSPTWS